MAEAHNRIVGRGVICALVMAFAASAISDCFFDGRTARIEAFVAFGRGGAIAVLRAFEATTRAFTMAPLGDLCPNTCLDPGYMQ